MPYGARSPLWRPGAKHARTLLLKQFRMPEMSDSMVDANAALRWIKPSVRGMGAYTLRHHEPRIKLNQNESPYDVPDELKQRIAERLEGRPWNRYPPFVAASFIGAVSEATGWPRTGSWSRTARTS